MKWNRVVGVIAVHIKAIAQGKILYNHFGLADCLMHFLPGDLQHFFLVCSWFWKFVLWYMPLVSMALLLLRACRVQVTPQNTIGCLFPPPFFFQNLPLLVLVSAVLSICDSTKVFRVFLAHGNFCQRKTEEQFLVCQMEVKRRTMLAFNKIIL